MNSEDEKEGFGEGKTYMGFEEEKKHLQNLATSVDEQRAMDVEICFMEECEPRLFQALERDSE